MLFTIYFPGHCTALYWYCIVLHLYCIDLFCYNSLKGTAMYTYLTILPCNAPQYSVLQWTCFCLLLTNKAFTADGYTGCLPFLPFFGAAPGNITSFVYLVYNGYIQGVFKSKDFWKTIRVKVVSDNEAIIQTCCTVWWFLHFLAVSEPVILYPNLSWIVTKPEAAFV